MMKAEKPKMLRREKAEHPQHNYGYSALLS